LRIGVICEGYPMPQKKAKIALIGKIGAVEVYVTSVEKCEGKRRFLRRVRKCAAELKRAGISLCVGEESFLPVRAFGVELFFDDTRILKTKAAAAAREFAAVTAQNVDFLITGGSAADLIKTACELLRFRKTVYVGHPSFEEIADVLFSETGASVRRDVPENVISVNLGSGEFISYEDFFADSGDFRVRFSENLLKELSESDLRRLASLLEISGFLRENEIKVEYSPKKISKFTNLLLDNST